MQYTGRENDGTGLSYYRARYQHPVLGRFISEDPIGLAGGANLYRYNVSDPVNHTDPTGKFGLPGFIIGAGINVGMQLIQNGGNWRDINVGEVVVAGAVGAVLPGLGTGLIGYVTTGAADDLIAAGAGVAVRQACALFACAGGPGGSLTLGDLFPPSGASNDDWGPWPWVDTSGPYPTGPGVVFPRNNHKPAPPTATPKMPPAIPAPKMPPAICP